MSVLQLHTARLIPQQGFFHGKFMRYADVLRDRLQHHAEPDGDDRVHWQLTCKSEVTLLCEGTRIDPYDMVAHATIACRIRATDLMVDGRGEIIRIKGVAELTTRHHLWKRLFDKQHIYFRPIGRGSSDKPSAWSGGITERHAYAQSIQHTATHPMQDMAPRMAAEMR